MAPAINTNQITLSFAKRKTLRVQFTVKVNSKSLKLFHFKYSKFGIWENFIGLLPLGLRYGVSVHYNQETFNLRCLFLNMSL